MTYRCLAVILSVAVLSSCAIRDYGDLPQVDLSKPPLPQREFPIYYRVDPVAYYKQVIYNEQSDFFFSFPPQLEDYEELERVFTQGEAFSSAIPASVPPDRGVYCSVEVSYVPMTDTEAVFLSISQYSASLLPSYIHTSGYTIRYDLYIHREFKKSYEYKITRKQFAWVVVLPFAWINLLTHDLKEAFRATAYQFFMDAALDGYLKPP